MNRNKYFEYIEEKLNFLSNRIVSKGKLNLLDINCHSENFYLYFFNLLYGYELENLNQQIQNVEAIDLIDKKRKIFIQVSATCTKQKIESSLDKKILESYKDYNFHFISIAKDASSLRKTSFKNPYSINFSPLTDIHDITSLLNNILVKEIDDMKLIYEFIKKELGNEIDIVKLDSNLTTIITILSKEQLDIIDYTSNINSFEIERKISFNNLKNHSETIRDYCIYHSKIDQKYSDFDSMGINKSLSILSSIHRLYIKYKNNNNDADSIFTLVINEIKEIVINSNNFTRIPIDELDLCIDILVVDAFIRCKIFENPKDYFYATTR